MNRNIYINVWQVIINGLTQEQLDKLQEELSEKSIVSASISKFGARLVIIAQTNSLNNMQLYNLLAKVIGHDEFEINNIGTLGPYKLV